MYLDMSDALSLRENLYETVKDTVTRYCQFVQADTNTPISIGITIPFIKVPLLNSAFSTSTHGQEGLKTADAFYRDVKSKYENGGSYYDMYKCICRLLTTDAVRENFSKFNIKLLPEMSTGKVLQYIELETGKDTNSLADPSKLKRNKLLEAAGVNGISRNSYGKNPIRSWTAHPHSLRYFMLREMFDGPILKLLKKVSSDNSEENAYSPLKSHYTNPIGSHIRNSNKEFGDIGSKYLNALFYKTQFREKTENGPFHWLGYYSANDRHHVSKEIYIKILLIYYCAYLISKDYELETLGESDHNLNNAISGATINEIFNENGNSESKQYANLMVYGNVDDAKTKVKEIFKANKNPNNKALAILFHEHLKDKSNLTKENLEIMKALLEK